MNIKQNFPHNYVHIWKDIFSAFGCKMHCTLTFWSQRQQLNLFLEMCIMKAQNRLIKLQIDVPNFVHYGQYI